jgi:outer membrane protein assembly factor BamB/tetratricopeptide (TPR) repeat protein
MRPWTWIRLTAEGAFAVVVWGGAAIALAQPIMIRAVVQADADESEANNDLAQDVFVPPERNVLQRLAKARQLLQEARYGEAVRYLGSILDGPEDYFFQPDKNVPVHRSLKAEAQRLIGQMPREGRDLYELQYGARARQKLAEAVSSGDAEGVAEVSRRFFHTQPGYEATLLMGLSHLDHGRPLAGALRLQQLREAVGPAGQFEPALSFALATCWLQSGAPEKAREVLCGLRSQLGGSPIEIGGKPVEWFQDEGQAVEWLARLVGPHPGVGPREPDSWLMYRGNASRNATTSATAPLLNVRWRIPTTDDPLMEAKLQRDREVYLDRGIPVLPGFHPLAVGDVVLMRTLRNLLAVDFVTGKRLWEVPADDPLEALLGSNALPNGVYNSAWIAAGVGYRVWEDATYGTISSDGRYVFSIEDLSVAIGANSPPRIVNRRQVFTPADAPFSRLAAHDIRTGKLKWHVGGPSDEFALRQAETFFLGPPLPLMGRLYVLGEARGEIRLFALDAESGDLDWTQQLALVERDIFQSPLRRLAGASPSYADGILVCPTSAGAVVAVDLATRSLLWGYRYGRYPNSGRSARLMALRMARYQGREPQNRWFDAPAIVADGRVLVTPPESDSLHCLNLIDGQLLWECDRDDDLFVACVYQDNVVLVGQRQVRAVSLSHIVENTETIQRIERTGGRLRLVNDQQTVVRPKPAWDNRTVALPEGSMPSGRGFLSGDRYFLPLSSAEVLAVDVATGKTVQVSKSRKGSVPGNLICYKGRVISQGVDGLEVFAQLGAVRREVDQRLAANPDDPVALSLQGEILLDQGKQSEAVASFRRSYDLDPDPRTRGLLRDALLDGLRLQFAAHRARSQEIEQLLDEPEQRATYLRLMATGLQAAGEWGPALERYLELIDLDEGHRRMQRITKALSVRLDHWVRAQLAALRLEAKAEAAAIDSAIEARLQAALQADSTDSLRQFLDYFGDHPTAGKARHELVRRLKESGRWLEAELVLCQQQSSDTSAAGTAMAELAELLRQAKRPEDAAWCYGRLGQEFAEVTCLDGKTGKELLDALPEDGPIQQVLRRDRQWPVGKVEQKESTTPSRAVSYPRFTVPYRGSLAPFFSETSIKFDQNRRLIASCDALGNQPWQLSLVRASPQRGISFSYGVTHARVCGHLLVLSLGDRIMAVDTLGLSSGGEPKLLWSQDLADPTFDLTTNVQQMAAVQIAGAAWAVPAVLSTGYPNGQTSGLGPVTASYASFQRYRDLVATDPLSGEVLWIRRDVAPNSTLFGDDQFLFAVAPGEREATVFRALDGELLGQRKVPRFTTETQILPDGTTRAGPRSSGQACIATFGRQLLVWNVTDNEAVLELFDPWQQRQVWPPREFSAGAKSEMVGQEAIGVLEPGGRFVLIGLPDGRTIADVELQRERRVSLISVFRAGDQYVLVTSNSQPQASPNRVIQALPGNLSRPIGRGRVYSFGLDGKLLWAEPVEIKDQHLLLDQPSRLPVLTFACCTYDRTRPGSAQRQVAVMCIDKRTGRVAYQGSFPYTPSDFAVNGDPKTKTVELNVSRRQVTLMFTDQPLPPAAKKGGRGEKLPPDLPEPARGLLKALEKAIGDAARKSAEPADDRARQRRPPQIEGLPEPDPAPRRQPPAPR